MRLKRNKKCRIFFRQHIPNFISGYEPRKYIVRSFESLLKKTKKYLDKNQIRDLVFTTNETGKMLMMSSTVKKWWWVLGYVSGIDLRTRLPRFDEVYKGEENETTDNGNDL